MKDKEIECFLNEAPVGRLGTSYNQQPYIVPIHFIFYEGKIYFHAKPEGTKLSNIKANKHVCFEVDELKEIITAETACSFSVRARSVIILGKARINNEFQEKKRILEKLVEKYSPGEPKQMKESEINEVVIGEITIDTIEGKKKYWD